MTGAFYSGADNIYDIIDTIVDKLIAEDSDWTDGDTTWTTTDRTEANNGRRCLKWSGDSADIWLALEIINAQGKEIDNSENERAKGFRVTFSSSWDSTNHTYGSTNSQTFVAFEAEADANATADMSTLQVNYYCWVDAAGFALMGTPEAHAGDSYQSPFICVIERLASKEYSDGFSNFFCFTDYRSDMDSWKGGDPTSGYMVNYMLRPFAYTEYDESGIQFWKDKWYAFKSTGNGKVYYMKPLIFNDVEETMPIGQSELFFKYSTESGLVDGDVVAIDGETTKYLCKSLAGPDSSQMIHYAIKYVA
ncbi:MAG: hypothetical protein RBT65_00650 [Methanolobus sp.]|nr:hypothetical protein [Methanolobus sp.]